jgi:hypothetical protein
MRKNKLFTALVLIMLAAVVIGCRNSPVHNVTNAPVTAPGKKALTQTSVRDAIVRAGSGLGWRLKEEKAGHMTGTLALRTHVAVVDITYDTKAYNINYKDSAELGYDGANIHKNYNGWVQNLDKRIAMELQSL